MLCGEDTERDYGYQPLDLLKKCAQNRGQPDSGQEDDCMSWPAVYQLAADVRAGKVKATDLVEQSLQAIKDKAEYNSIIATLDDAARARAAAVDKDPKGRLAGVPFIAKDNFLVFGAETTAASNILKVTRRRISPRQ